MATVNTVSVKDSSPVKLRNFTAHSIVYTTPSTNIRREIPAGGSIKVTAGEIREMTYDLGCSNLLKDYLQVCNKELAEEVGVSEDSIEHEYNWNKDDVIRCLQSDDLAELENAMDFAPAGIKELILNQAVELEIPDIRKREIISEATGRNVSQIIENKHQIEKTDTTAAKETPKRRTTAKTATTTRRRKTAAETETAKEE